MAPIPMALKTNRAPHLATTRRPALAAHMKAAALTLALTIAWGALPAHAADPTPAAQGPGWIDRVQQEFTRVWQQGSPGIYLPLYTYHSRSGYTREKLDELNELTWGLGYHRTLRDASGNYRSLFAMGLSDSHRDLQLQVGYSYEWVWQRAGPLELRLGGSALIFRRTDIYGGVPFPGLLPLLSAGTRNFDMKLTHIPRISKNLNNGDVTFFMATYTF
jgi:lipid IVA palmitoyltransferase